MVHRVRCLVLSATLGIVSLPAAAQEIPDLVGTWKGATTAVHVGSNPYRATGQEGVTFSSDPIEFTYTISEQQDGRFAGEMSGGTNRETIIGALRPDNQGGVMLDNDGQYHFTLRDPNTIDLCYSHLNPSSRVVACWTVTRSQ